MVQFHSSSRPRTHRHRHFGRSRSIRWRRPSLERMEGRTLLSGPTDDYPDQRAGAPLLDLATHGPATRRGVLETPAGVDVFRLTLRITDRLAATVRAPGAGTVLTLVDDQGQFLVRSDGRFPTEPDVEVDPIRPDEDLPLTFQRASAPLDVLVLPDGLQAGDRGAQQPRSVRYQEGLEGLGEVALVIPRSAANACDVISLAWHPAPARAS
jgi:hypothetical protein